MRCGNNGSMIWVVLGKWVDGEDISDKDEEEG